MGDMHKSHVIVVIFCVLNLCCYCHLLLNRRVSCLSDDIMGMTV